MGIAGSALPVPAYVVVDSRNVRGQVKDLFGVGRHVSVPGVCQILSRFGFDVQEVWFGIATTGPKNPSAHLASELDKNADFAARVTADARGRVLEGRLVERRGAGTGLRTEEKLVDVLCAMQVSRLAHDINAGRRSGSIVVLSEDMDLIPSYEFARELDVPVYAAANETVDTRSEHSRWLLLPEGALSLGFGRLLGRDQGSALRRVIARLLLAEQQVTMTFKVTGADLAAGRVYLQHNSGARAVWSTAKIRRKGDKFDLHVTGVDFDEGPFPRLTVSDAEPAAWPLVGVHEAEVVRWQSPTRALVRVVADGGRHTVEAPCGSLLPGGRVVVHHARQGDQDAWRLVGAVAARTETPGWADATCPEIVRAITTAPSVGALVRAMLGSEQITLRPPRDHRAVAGELFAATPIGHTEVPSGVHVTAVAVSSPLG
ncbi:hypothetical protein EV189_0387 [Motilibacter rhizosphaerae]|uniref:NYN domain-containing protein n=1 Tax=Motilibacter rhizosphaerae TaxID=598652 RepID=A0A4Q7NV91_9ACTN|nr:hypothetical protein [Motilibacter rhizosphaerae]RZS91153.1 hypothetical protein EV189_0387 [Motilibacter rhizosphaerae]